jgi:hypothetical protein
MKPNESKSEKFQRIAERRVNETIRALRLLGNLADRRNYEYSDDQASLLVGAIDQEVRALRFKFKSESATSGRPFRFRKGV